MMVHELKADRIRVSNFVSGSTTTEFGSNFSAEEIGAIWPEWEASGYLSAWPVQEWIRLGWPRRCSFSSPAPPVK
jgi:hypothetical protein